MSTTLSSTESTSDGLGYYDPNEISPKTKSLTESIIHFFRFILKLVRDNARRKRFLKLRQRASSTSTKKIPAWYRTVLRLNEQRKNVVTLAGYTASIVAPSFLFLTLGALMTSIIPHYYAKCIQLVATLDPTPAHVYEAMIGLAVSNTLGALFTGMRGSLFWIGGSRANYNVRVKLHRNLLLQEAAFFDSTETGYLLSRLNNDVNKIGMVISYHVNVVMRQLAQFIFGSVYLIKISPELALYAFAGIIVVAWVSAVYGKFSRDLAERTQDTYADATAVAETSFSMSETIRAFNGVEVESAKYEDAQSKALDLEEVQAWGYGAHKFVSDTIQGVLQVLLLLGCWNKGMSGGLPASALTTFLFYTNFVLESSNEVGDQWAKIQSAIGASTSVFELIRRMPAVRDPPKNMATDQGDISLSPSPIAANGGDVDIAVRNPIIEMKNMTIKYGAMDLPALDKVNLKIFEGDRVAIVGRSGSGKSSMLRAILRFYDPCSGSIELGGQPLKSLSRKALSKRVSVVEQEPSLFPMTLLENVLYGIEKDDIDQASGKRIYSESLRTQASNSLRLAGLHVHPGNDLNLDLDTRVGEGGRSLSGGQRQRVAIARSLIRSPEVLLLDEPTAALDSQSEKKVISALRKAMKVSKSMVMVTHRLGVIRSLDVNRVIVMERGKIVEQGHPEDLLRKEGGLYASLAREQGITGGHVSTSLINKYLP